MRTRFLCVFVCSWMCAAAASADETAISLGELPLWFVDDGGIAARRDLYRTVHEAQTLDKPVLEPKQPWEGGRLYLYGSVYADPRSRELSMWYMSCSSAVQGSDHVLLAKSTDGVRWTKPELGITDFAGSKANNIVYEIHSPSVLLDEFEKDPARRYKMLGSQKAKTKGYRGYAAAYSPDGLHWTEHPKNPVLSSSDTITLAQNPRTGEYLAYHKRPTTVGEFKRRVVWLSRSTDFDNWSEPELVLKPDEQDDAWVRRPAERMEIYNLSVFPHAAGFLGLPTMFRVIQEKSRDAIELGESPLDGPIDIQLVTSGDGREWKRTLPRVNVLPRGVPGSFDGGAILGVSSTPIHRGDKTWVYYTAINTGHGGKLPTKRLTIGRAEWRRDGFVSLDADPMGGTLTTKPLRLAGPSLRVNADASRGELRAALLEADGRPMAGYTLADCRPMQVDSTAWSVAWGDKTAVPTDRPVQVLIEMKSTALFSLSSGPATPQSEGKR